MFKLMEEFEFGGVPIKKIMKIPEHQRFVAFKVRF